MNGFTTWRVLCFTLVNFYFFFLLHLEISRIEVAGRKIEIKVALFVHTQLCMQSEVPRLLIFSIGMSWILTETIGIICMQKEKS